MTNFNCFQCFFTQDDLTIPIFANSNLTNRVIPKHIGSIYKEKTTFLQCKILFFIYNFPQTVISYRIVFHFKN